MQHLATCAFLAALLAGCGPQVHSDVAGPDLGDRLTYSWAPDITITPRLGTRERLRVLDQTLRNAVDEELAKRGYQQLASAETDMIVTYEVLLEDKNPSTLRDYADYRSMGGDPGIGKALTGYTEGTLIIELIDPYSRQPLWQSSATAIPDPKGRGEQLPAVVRQMMAPLPMRQ